MVLVLWWHISAIHTTFGQHSISRKVKVTISSSRDNFLVSQSKPTFCRDRYLDNLSCILTSIRDICNYWQFKRQVRIKYLIIVIWNLLPRTPLIYIEDHLLKIIRPSSKYLNMLIFISIFPINKLYFSSFHHIYKVALS